MENDREPNPEVRIAVFDAIIASVGAWRSLVAHLLWEQGVLSSNLSAPTIDLLKSVVVIIFDGTYHQAVARISAIRHRAGDRELSSNRFYALARCADLLQFLLQSISRTMSPRRNQSSSETDKVVANFRRTVANLALAWSL